MRLNRQFTSENYLTGIYIVFITLDKQLVIIGDVGKKNRFVNSSDIGFAFCENQSLFGLVISLFCNSLQSTYI